jgi:uncharacterized protein
MLLNIKEMEARKIVFAKTFAPGEFDLAESRAVQKTPLVAEGVAELVPGTDGEIQVHGHIKTELETECDRCLGRASFPIDMSFDLFYSPSTAAPAEDEVAIDEGAAAIGFYDPPGLELEDILREQVLLQLPMQRVCSEACRGICPLCGVNRNETECHCEARFGDDRWKALKDLSL